MKSKTIKKKRTKKVRTINKKTQIGDDYLKCMFSRFGGKCNKAKELTSYFPIHSTFVEPFLGSGAIFLAKEKSDKSVLNDLDTLMYSIWTNVQKNGDKFDKINNREPYDLRPDRSKWTRFLKTHLKGSSTTQLYKSLYVMKNSFNGMGNSFTAKRYPPHLQKTYKVELTKYKEKLKGAIILNKDYKEVIKKYDSKDTFFYLDPPYEVAIKKGGYYEHSDINLEEMSKLLSNIKGKFLMSMDITPSTKKLFKQFYLKKILFKYATRTTDKEIYEYLITNYKL